MWVSFSILSSSPEGLHAWLYHQPLQICYHQAWEDRPVVASGPSLYSSSKYFGLSVSLSSFRGGFRCWYIVNWRHSWLLKMGFSGTPVTSKLLLRKVTELQLHSARLDFIEASQNLLGSWLSWRSLENGHHLYTVVSCKALWVFTWLPWFDPCQFPGSWWCRISLR